MPVHARVWRSQSHTRIRQLAQRIFKTASITTSEVLVFCGLKITAAVDSLPSAGAWLFGLCCPLCVRPLHFLVIFLGFGDDLPCRARGLSACGGFSCLLLCALMCAQATARRHPAPTLCTSFHIVDVLEGRLGMPTLFRVLFSGGSPSLAHSLLCSSRLRR